ncbi:hypothetical protein QP794_29125 [Paenibacillus sp. UMB7766-LJ446]|uniref:hypothetical protein n=1 Tax=Paenibacillus sp. UMB7766-LJ446 TaxID=3046313 RepID=UPI0025507E97|nr:hypothetical protein [Paenibacillus sp. UMB7766-LJ446]MDK8194144.1 hypothetical protein [Paenibacillus sp. UMB7766-LJ446]
MSWLKEDIAETWRSEGKRYAKDVNAFVRRGMAGEQVDESELEADARVLISTEVWNMVKQANLQGDLERLRLELPAATWPLNENFQSFMQAVRVVGYLNAETIVFTIGTFTENGSVYTADQHGCLPFSQYTFAGCSPDSADYALAGSEDIRIIRQPDRHLVGQEIAVYRWEDIQSSIQQALPRIESLADCEHPERTLEGLIPFNDGKSVLIFSTYGIYLLDQGQLSLLHPDLAEIEEYELEDTQIDMGHAAVSRDGRWIAYGSQVSNHMILDREQNKTYSLYPESSYPHHAVFTTDSLKVWFNACHFYNGATIQVQLETIDGNESKEDWPVMDENARVYAAVAIDAGMMLGDAYGYLYCVNSDGQEVWRHFVGSTIYSLASSPDQSKLAVGTFGGMLHFLDLHSQEMDEYGIGTGTIRELERYVLWRGEEPVRW